VTAFVHDQFGWGVLDRRVTDAFEIGLGYLERGRQGLGIALSLPVLVAKLLVWPFLVLTDQIIGHRRLDPTFPGQALEHLAITLAAIPTHDRPERRVGPRAEVSKPMRSLVISPCSSSRAGTQANTTSCTSNGKRDRVLERQERSDTVSKVDSSSTRWRERASGRRCSIV
jgi:hypothetical protein